ncbi:hypothetical protein PR048_032841, partial [Dryococelus australis]
MYNNLRGTVVKLDMVKESLMLKKKLNVDEVYGTNSDCGVDLNVTIKARNTNIGLNSIVSGTVLRVRIQGRKECYTYYAVVKDIVREEDVRVVYLVSCSKEHDLFKGSPNSVDHECNVSDIIDI